MPTVDRVRFSKELFVGKVEELRDEEFPLCPFRGKIVFLASTGVVYAIRSESSGNKVFLFAVDLERNVCVKTDLDAFFNETKTSFLHSAEARFEKECDFTVLKLEVFKRDVVVSTTKRVFLLKNALEKSGLDVVGIGSKGHVGEYLSAVCEDYLLCSRPKGRVWVVDTSGLVGSTMRFPLENRWEKICSIGFYLVTYEQNVLYLYNRETIQLVSTLLFPEEIIDVAFSPSTHSFTLYLLCKTKLLTLYLPVELEKLLTFLLSQLDTYTEEEVCRLGNLVAFYAGKVNFQLDSTGVDLSNLGKRLQGVDGVEGGKGVITGLEAKVDCIAPLTNFPLISLHFQTPPEVAGKEEDQRIEEEKGELEDTVVSPLVPKEIYIYLHDIFAYLQKPPPCLEDFYQKAERYIDEGGKEGDIAQYLFQIRCLQHGFPNGKEGGLWTEALAFAFCERFPLQNNFWIAVYANGMRWFQLRDHILQPSLKTGSSFPKISQVPLGNLFQILLGSISVVE